MEAQAADLHFGNPPLFETAIGVQFRTHPEINTGHFGWYWREILGTTDWPTTRDAVPIASVHERFGERMRRPMPAAFPLQFQAAPLRFAARHRDNQRFVQIQNTRFMCNWKKGESEYPHYGASRADFLAKFQDFRTFITTAGLKPLDVDQWEFVYLNHVPQGPLWETPADWYRVLPVLFTEIPRVEGVSYEAGTGEWQFVIPPDIGRVHVSVNRSKAPNGTDIMVVQLVARGPVRESEGRTIEAGLDAGHNAACTVFTTITSPEAQAHWQRRQ